MNVSSFVRKMGRLFTRSHRTAVLNGASADNHDASIGLWFQRLVEAAPDTLAYSDLQGNLLMVNTHAARLHGYSSPAEMIAEAKTILGLVAPSDRARAGALVATFLQSGSMEPSEFEFVRRDGSTFPAEISAAIIRDQGGAPIGILGLARDISAHRQAQGKLREYASKVSILAQTAAHLAGASSPEEAYAMLADRLRELSEALIVGVSTYDAATETIKTRVISGLERYRSLLEPLFGGSPVGAAYTLSNGARQQVQTGQLHDVPSFYDLMLGRVPEPVAKTIEQAIGIGQIYSIGLVKDEQILGLASIVMPAGQVIAFPEIVETMARQSTSLLLRQAAEQSVRESEERFRTLFQEIGDAFILLDAALVVVDCHDSPQGLLDFCREHLIGQPLDTGLPELIVGEPTLMDGLRDLLRTGDSRTYTRLHYAPTAATRSVLYLDLTAYAVRLGGQPHVALLCRDVSRRVSLEAQLLQAQGQATFAHIIAGVAHDVGGLLAVIRAAAELLADSSPTGSPEQGAIESIQVAVERGDVLRRQVLNLSRTDPVPFEILDLNHVVQNAVGLLRFLVGSGIRLEFRPAEQNVFLWGDEGLIIRILLNLADNARDAMPDGGSLAIETRLESVGSERAQNWGIEAGIHALLTVRDTGTGISQDSLVRLFDPFFSTKPRQRHSGLGLSTVAEVVKQHKGHIEVQSALGEGATFEIYLPAIDASDLESEQ
jgi:PAS domain S-box-containing protein